MRAAKVILAAFLFFKNTCKLVNFMLIYAYEILLFAIQSRIALMFKIPGAGFVLNFVVFLRR